MNRTFFSLVALLMVLGSPHVVRAQDEPAKVKITNKICPMANIPNAGESVNVEHRGRTITLCCEACLAPWFKLTEAERDAKLAQVVPVKVVPQCDPYPFATCPVSGKALDSMGGAVIKQYDGREVRFCCKGCVGKFEKNREKFDAKIDRMIVEDQLGRYPLTTCVVSGEKLGTMGKPIDKVIGNRLFRLCCNACTKKLAADPDSYRVKLDAAVVKAQSANYPLKTCVVTGKKLGSMGDPHEIVVAGRLVRLCCKGCVETLTKAPAGYIAKLDAAAKTGNKKG